jgi:hypothetical protein
MNFVAGIFEYGTIFEWLPMHYYFLSYQILFIITYLIIFPLVFVGFYLFGKKFDLKLNLKWSIISLLTGACLGYFLSSCCWYFTREILPHWTELIRIGLSPIFVHAFLIALSALSIAYLRNNNGS